MKKSMIIFIVVITVILVGAYFYFTNEEDICEELLKNFDKVITDRNNHPEPSRMQTMDIVVGGTLIEAKESDFGFEGYNDYILKFKGRDKEGWFYYQTNSEDTFPYEVGKFYKFDLSDIRLSGYHSGIFIDNDLDKLELMDC